MNNPQECPVLQDAQNVLAAGENLTRAVRRLRTSRRMCQRCPALESCPVWREFNCQIDAAIQQVNLEWGLV